MSETDNTETGRPHRGASKVTDFRTYHTRGNTTEEEGTVAAAVRRIETPNKSQEGQAEEGDISPTPILIQLGSPGHTPKHTPDTSPTMSELAKLREELEKQRALNQQAQEELEAAKLRSQLEAEKRRQLEIENARKQIELEDTEAKHEFQEHLQQVKQAEQLSDKDTTIRILQEKLKELTGTNTAQERKQQEAADQLKKLVQQQQQLALEAIETVKTCEPTPEIQELLGKLQPQEPPEDRDAQKMLLTHLTNMLQGKKEENKVDKQKEILQQFLLDSNKVTTTGGATTLKPGILKKLSGESDTFNMGEWLAKLNRREGEEIKCEHCNEECKNAKKSGMLDKSYY